MGLNPLWVKAKMLSRFRLILSFDIALPAIAFVILLWLPLQHASGQVRPQSPVPLPVPFTPIVDNANVIDPHLPS